MTKNQQHCSNIVNSANGCRLEGDLHCAKIAPKIVNSAHSWNMEFAGIFSAMPVEKCRRVPVNERNLSDKEADQCHPLCPICESFAGYQLERRQQALRENVLLVRHLKFLTVHLCFARMR